MAAKKPLTRRHYAVLCDALEGRDLVLFRFAVDSMLRSSDVCNLRVRDLVDSTCLLYTSPSPRDVEESRMPSSA